MYKNIEFVCSANVGRSHIGEARASNMLGILGLQDEVTVSSSGSMWDLNSDADAVREGIPSYVEKAMKRGILPEGSMERLQSEPLAVVNELIENEGRMRVEYLLKSMGYDSSGHAPRQTIVRPEVELILPMDEGNLKRVTKLYEGSENKPRIETLGEFSGLGYGLTQDYPETNPEYVKTALRVETAARAAILKALDLAA